MVVEVRFEVCTGVYIKRPNPACMTHLTLLAKPNPFSHAAGRGPYVIRTYT